MKTGLFRDFVGFIIIYRLKTLVPVSYKEILPKGKRESSEEDLEICIREGSKPEIYTEEHEKLLGDCKTAWTLLVDGYGEDGKRIYDNVNGETCHQCRFMGLCVCVYKYIYIYDVTVYI